MATLVDFRLLHLESVGCSWSLLPPGCLFDTIVAQPATPGKFSVCPCGVMGDARNGPGPSQEGSVFF